MRKRRPKTFSATKAVKANARERLGTPPPTSPIPDRKHKTEHGPAKHKPSLTDLVEQAKQSEDT